jgi:hypothetical protein
MATPEAVGEAPQEDAAAKPRQRPGRNSGRLLLRMPAGLHEELARAADRSGISLNQFITNVLAGAVGWGRPASAGAGTSKRRPQTLTILLGLNLLLVAAAAAAAIAFLVAAWLN